MQECFIHGNQNVKLKLFYITINNKAKSRKEKYKFKDFKNLLMILKRVKVYYCKIKKVTS